LFFALLGTVQASGGGVRIGFIVGHGQYSSPDIPRKNNNRSLDIIKRSRGWGHGDFPASATCHNAPCRPRHGLRGSRFDPPCDFQKPPRNRQEHLDLTPSL
jgi:hypothetical protein